MTRRARPFLVFAFLSGASVLLYQVAWSRLLTLEIGLTAGAVSTVLAAFMGGLALGAAAAGRWGVGLSPRAALAAWACLELAAGLTALGVQPLLAEAAPLLASVYRDGQGGFSFGVVRIGICLLVITVPASCLGAAFPLAVRWLEQQTVHAGRTAGTFYAAHTLGAAAGAAVTGLLLLPALGVQDTTRIGVLLNATVVAGALILLWDDRATERRARATTTALVPATLAAPSGNGSADALPRPDPRRAAVGADSRTSSPVGAEWSARPHPTSAAITLGISGFIALVHQVAWTRVIALTIGPMTYAFSVMLASCILGLAVGSALAARRLPHVRRPVTALALTQIGGALGAFLAARAVPALPGIVAALVPAGSTFESRLAIESALIAGLLFPMTLALGAAFPFGVATAAPAGGDAARPAARVYTANTLGAIAGALAGGFVLIPTLGLQRTILLAGLLGVLTGVELIWRTRRRGHARVWVPMLGLLTASFGLVLPAWNPAALVSGSAWRRVAGDSHDLRGRLDAGTLLYYGDGASGTVSVRRVAGTIALAVNGAVEASNTDDMLRLAVLAHLPLLLHPSPTDICILGLGSGVTAGAALAHPVDRVDTIELSPEVAHASDLFSTENRAALSDPRGHLLIGDGRTHLRFARHAYDVILSEPSSPWVAGAAPLFTRELFTAARDRLQAGGLFGQRVQLRGLSVADFRSILATFVSVFPHTSLWLLGDADVIIVGSTEPMAPLVARLPRRWEVLPGVVADLERVHVRDPFGLLSTFVAEEDGVRRLAAGGLIQTDDRMGLDFSVPRSLHQRHDYVAWLTGDTIRQARPAFIQEAERAATAVQWRNRALMLQGAHAEGLAYDAAVRALAGDPADGDALRVIAQTARGLGRQAAALRLLDEMATRAPDSLLPLLALSRLRGAMGERDEALAIATLATQRFPERLESWQQLALLLADARAADRLAPVFDAMRARFPDRWETRYVQGELHLLRGELSEAARLGEAVLRERASDPRTLALVGAAYDSLGIRTRARDAFEASIQSDPRDPINYVRLARLELAAFNAPRAADLFSEALVLDPRLPAALNGLADALSAMGRGDRARELRARAGS